MPGLGKFIARSGIFQSQRAALLLESRLLHTQAVIERSADPENDLKDE